MLQRLRADRKKDSGFTLTELLIVIVILGVLTGIVVFAVGAFSDRGTQAACLADKKNVEVAAEAYRAKNNKYPVGTPTDDSDGRIKVLVDDKYLRTAPSKANYTITLNGDGTVSAGTAC